MINSWSISDNSCSKNKSVYICGICGKLFVSFELLLFPSASDLWFVFVNKNLCISVLSVGDYSCHSSYSCSRNKSV